MADLLIRNGIDPRSITSEATIKKYFKSNRRSNKKVNKQSTTTSGIRNTDISKSI